MVDKKINGLIIEIILVSILIFASSIVWKNINVEEQAKIAYAYSNMNKKLELELTNNIKELKIEKDENVKDKTNIELKIKNDLKIKKEFEIYLKIDNNINNKYLKLKIDNKIFKLDDFEHFYKGKDVYYKIYEDEIKAYHTNKYKLYVFLSNETLNKDIFNDVNMTFYVEEM